MLNWSHTGATPGKGSPLCWPHGFAAMKFTPITATSEASVLEALLPRATWEGCLSADPTPMQHYIWNRASYESLYSSAPVELVSVPGGIAAFARKGVVPTLYLAGAEELAEPTEPVYTDAAAAERLAERILAMRLPVRMGQPVAETPFAEIFIRLARRTGVLLTGPTEGAPYLELDDSWKNALARFSSRRRSDFRRMQRRAEEYGPITCEFHAPTPADSIALLEQAIAVEARSWKARTKTAIADNPDQAAFFRTYVPLAAAERILRIAFLKIGDEYVAAQIAAECDGAFWLFKIGYDEQFARCSPGQLLMLESIERAARLGLRRFEFLGKSADWTRFWTTAERPRMRLRYYPWTATGIVALLRDVAVLAAQKGKALLART